MKQKEMGKNTRTLSTLDATRPSLFPNVAKPSSEGLCNHLSGQVLEGKGNKSVHGLLFPTHPIFFP